MKRLFFLFALALLTIGGTYAQWSAGITLGTSFNSGNINKFDLSSNGEVSHKDSMFEFSGYYNLLYSEVNNLQNSEEYAGGIKFDYRPYARFTPFVLGAAYQNIYKNIDMRTSALFGAKYRVYKTDKSDYSLSAAVQYDMNKYVSETPDDNITRLSIRPKIKQKLGDYVTFEHITFYQPNVSDFQDYRIDSSTRLKTKINDVLAFQVSYNLDYVSKPTKVGLKKTDQYMLASLAISL